MEKGNISGYRLYLGVWRMQLAISSLMKGYSGCPVFGADGKVIGMVQKRMRLGLLEGQPEDHADFAGPTQLLKPL